MKTISATAIVALMTATLGLSAMAPASAQDTNAAPAAAQAEPSQPASGDQRGFRPGAGNPRQVGLGGDFLGFERGTEAVEIALVRLGHRLDLTAAQKALLDTLKTDALAAAETFEKATETLLPARSAEGETAGVPDISARLQNRIDLAKARLAALESVQPAFAAFFDSLTDEQKAELTPQRGERPGFGGQFGHSGAHEGKAGPRPGGPARPAAPTPQPQG
ncbi:MAG: hypothetical protein ABS76_26200 [Pelagibacterium sp. SCN 64-44]|nr:MAG: hypothetical protein ABS76_26200 [Pelagibacterium sp. SCN 64-44]